MQDLKYCTYVSYFVKLHLSPAEVGFPACSISVFQQFFHFFKIFGFFKIFSFSKSQNELRSHDSELCVHLPRPAEETVGAGGRLVSGTQRAAKKLGPAASRGMRRILSIW